MADPVVTPVADPAAAPAPPSPPGAVTEAMKIWMKDNPSQASIVLAGVACFAAVATVISFGINLESNISSALYIIGVGLVLAIAARIGSDKLMLAALSWFAILLLVLWVATYLALNTLPLSASTRQQLSCAVWLVRDCRALVDQETASPATPNTIPILPALPTAPNVVPANYAVTMQFAGSLDRGSVRTVMQQLSDLGWNVQGVKGGGERTAAAASTSEIRFAAGDEAAAKALATLVDATKISLKPVHAVQNSRVTKGTLEIWVSQ